MLRPSPKSFLATLADRHMSHVPLAASPPSSQKHPPDLVNRFAWVQTFRTHICAVKNSTASLQFERIIDDVQPMTSGFITRVDEPPPGMQERCGPQESISVPPVARTGCGAAGA